MRTLVGKRLLVAHLFGILWRTRKFAGCATEFSSLIFFLGCPPQPQLCTPSASSTPTPSRAGSGLRRPLAGLPTACTTRRSRRRSGSSPYTAASAEPPTLSPWLPRVVSLVLTLAADATLAFDHRLATELAAPLYLVRVEHESSVPARRSLPPLDRTQRK